MKPSELPGSITYILCSEGECNAQVETNHPNIYIYIPFNTEKYIFKKNYYNLIFLFYIKYLYALHYAYSEEILI